MMDAVDTLVLGSGMAGLSVAALLARDGERVHVLEAHEHPGGYAHTFPMGKWHFCAQAHYIFHCDAERTIGRFLKAVGLDAEVRFRRLSPEGFDHIVVAGERYPVPNGLAQHCERLARRFPAEQSQLRSYFTLLTSVSDELDKLPDEPGVLDWLTAPFRFPRLIRDRSSTLQDVYDRLRLSPRLQAVLAGQAGDYLLPPEKVSFLLHTALVCAYDRGAYYPERHFRHLVDAMVSSIANRPGCEVKVRQRVVKIEVHNGRVIGVRTEDGKLHTARRYVSNIDPKQTLTLADPKHFPPAFLSHCDYDYSCGSFTLYLGTKGLDLRDYGFGSFNVWHYPHDDLNKIYADLERGDFQDPWLFISTPTLHTDVPGLAPPNGQVLVVATACPHEPFRELRERDARLYRKEKRRIKERILDVLEEHYIPGLRKHLAIQVAGTATTNEWYCGSPRGNAYGAALTPANAMRRVPMKTPLRNLFLCNASAGWPSVAGTIGSGMRLHQMLSRGRR